MTSTDYEVASKLRTAISLLSKLTFENFDAVTSKLIDAIIPEIYEDLVDRINERAINESRQGDLFALLCEEIIASIPDDNNVIQIKGFIKSKAIENFDKYEKEIQIQDEDKEKAAEIKYRHDYRFLGREYYRSDLISEQEVDHVFHCLLLSQPPTNRNVEATLILMRDIGRYIQENNQTELFEKYFQILKELENSNNNQISKKTQALVEDLINLKEKNWILPKTYIPKNLPERLEEIQNKEDENEKEKEKEKEREKQNKDEELEKS